METPPVSRKAAVCLGWVYMGWWYFFTNGLGWFGMFPSNNPFQRKSCKGLRRLWQTNIAIEKGPGMKMYVLLKMVIFHCHVSLPEGI